jgi:phosphoribosylamine---glycine ligase
MRILVVGHGGREHALLWKLRRDAPDAELFVTRGNGGTAELATSLPLDPGETQALAGWAEQHAVDLTVVGPEGPLAMGIVDHFQARRLPVFGPTRDAAEIESSKAFAKRLMQRQGVPTAAHRTFRTYTEAEAYIRAHGAPLVVKASGLAAGKGAVVCMEVSEALDAAREMLTGGSFGEAGQEVVVEEFMEGEELSVFALCDGRTAVLLQPAQDHKRIGEGDTGPNTGGMGAYAPVSLSSAALLDQLQDRVFEPVLAGMAKEGRSFSGLLYAGLMLTPEGPKVVEFNCRFGDPETQVVVPMMEGPLLEPLLMVARGARLPREEMAFRPGAAVTTVVAAEGYPGKVESGREMELDPGLESADDVLVFHAGTRLEGDRLVTAGGRVCAVTGFGKDVAAAAERSRWGAERVRFAGAQHRRDIGWREIARGPDPQPREP